MSLSDSNLWSVIEARLAEAKSQPAFSMHASVVYIHHDVISKCKYVFVIFKDGFGQNFVAIPREVWDTNPNLRELIESNMSPKKLDLPAAPPSQLVGGKNKRQRALTLPGPSAITPGQEYNQNISSHKLTMPSPGTTNTLKSYTNQMAIPSSNAGTSHPHGLGLPGAQKAPDVVDFIQEAYSINPKLAYEHNVELNAMFMSLSKINDQELIRWGEKSIEPLRASTDMLTEMNKRFNLINTNRWVQGALKASQQGKPGFFDRLGDFNGTINEPIFYEAMLKKCQGELRSLLVYIGDAKGRVQVIQTPLAVEALAFLTFSAHTQGNTQRLSTNRMASLTASMQTVENFLQTCNNTEALIMSQIQDVDQLLDVTLPAWKIAYAARK